MKKVVYFGICNTNISYLGQKTKSLLLINHTGKWGMIYNLKKNHFQSEATYKP